MVCSLTPPFQIISINSAWWTLQNLTSYPPESEYKERPLRTVLQELNHFPLNIVEHLSALLPQVSLGIPVRVPFVSSLTGKKVFLYLRAVPLANESLERACTLLTLSEAPLSPQMTACVPDDTLITASVIPLNSTPTLPIPGQSGWDILRKTPYTQTIERPALDQTIYPLQFQPSPVIDPVWGGSLPFSPSQVLDPSFRSQFT